MALYITSLNSGSNGNCYYVGNETEAVLIDAGISCREIEKRMKLLNLSIKKVKAIFISHEHTDHIKGLSTLANKYNLPVYITTATLQNGPKLIRHLSKNFIKEEPVSIGNLLVTAFAKDHDAIDAHSFVVSCSSVTVGVFTDIGIASPMVIKYFSRCTACFLEANYDEELLKNGNYPHHLKERIKSDKGHLSNSQANELFRKHKPPYMSHLILSHLSKENNSPELVKSLFSLNAGKTAITVASRYEASPIIAVTDASDPLIIFQSMQLDLFEKIAD
jgi:phosphoribosyl 1,2-cyclic phosphodiesterase